MARIAIVESYPYEAVWGGDAVYIDRIRSFLTGKGHMVDSYVTDVARGRSSPLLRLRTRAGPRNRWIVRHAVARGRDRFVAYDAGLLRKALTYVPGRAAPPEHGVTGAEAAWLLGRMRKAPPDLILTAFGACDFIAALAPFAQVIALKGFFADRRIRLGEPAAAPPSPDPATLDALRHAARATFNNLEDLDHYRRLSGADNGALLGMSFPGRPQPPSDGEAVILFVGVRTKPNVESLRWFIDGIWPEVRKAVPASRLRIVGTIGTAFAGLGDERIGVAGFADDLDAEYRRAKAVIAPLVSGSSGIKTKVAEALSYGRALVTTSLGVDPGNPGQFGDAVGIADEPAHFASALIALLVDDALRRTREEQARIVFQRYFSDEAAYAALVPFLEADRFRPIQPEKSMPSVPAGWIRDP